MSHIKISACIITLNEADRIADCIKSLDFCDEVLVVDSHSVDKTREIAIECGARVIERDWPGCIKQREYSIAEAKHDWVLCMDADERVSPELREEIMRLRDAGFPGFQGWKLLRVSFYMGRWIRHGTWYPDYVMRLFDRRVAQVKGNEPHDRIEVDGKTSKLKSELMHYPYRSLAEHLQRMDKYTTVMAHTLNSQGKKASLFNVVINPWTRFVKYYFLRAGFLDGWRGLVMAYLASQYVRTKYIKLMVMQRVGHKTD